MPVQTINGGETRRRITADNFTPVRLVVPALCGVLADCRDELGWTQAEMADALGAATPSYWRWEAGESSPNVDVLLTAMRRRTCPQLVRDRVAQIFIIEPPAPVCRQISVSELVGDIEDQFIGMTVGQAQRVVALKQRLGDRVVTGAELAAHLGESDAFRRSLDAGDDQMRELHRRTGR